MPNGLPDGSSVKDSMSLAIWTQGSSSVWAVQTVAQMQKRVTSIGSLLITHHRPAVAAEVNDFRRFGIVGWLQAKVQENAMPTERALEGQFGGVKRLACAEAQRIRLEIVQEFQHVE